MAGGCGRRRGGRARPAGLRRHPRPARRTRRGRSRRPGPCPPRPRAPCGRWCPPDTVDEVAKALRSGERAALLLGGTRAAGGRAARRRAASRSATGAALLGETFPANLERGAGHPGGGAARPTSPRWHRPSSRACAIWCWSTPVAGLVLRLSGQGERPGPARAAPSTRWPVRAKTRRAHCEALADAVGRAR